MKKVWYIFSEDHHLGPFEVREITQKLKDGEVSRKALLWKEGMKDWVVLEKIPDKQRSTKITLCLANLYTALGSTRAAVAAYKIAL